MNEFTAKTIAESLTPAQQQMLIRLYYTKYSKTGILFLKKINSNTINNICSESNIRISNCYPLIKKLMQIKVFVFHENGDNHSNKYFVDRYKLAQILVQLKEVGDIYNILKQQFDEYLTFPSLKEMQQM